MIVYLRRRLLAAVPVILGVVILVFMIMHLVPGDPVAGMFDIGDIDPVAYQEARARYHLDESILAQFGYFVRDVLNGSFGISMRQSRPVRDVVLSNIMPTVQLTIAALFVSSTLGVVLGVIAGSRPDSLLDTLTSIVATLGVAMPSFWLALLLMILFSLKLGWLPAAGQGTWKHLVMPALALGLPKAAIVARTIRAGIIETMQEDYIRTAWAKGLTEMAVLYGHVLRNVMIPVITIIGLQAGALLGGMVIIESVFARQGLGSVIQDAMLFQDYPVAQGAALVVAFTYTLINILVDVAYAFIDPRIRYQ